MSGDKERNKKIDKTFDAAEEIGGEALDLVNTDAVPGDIPDTDIGGGIEFDFTGCLLKVFCCCCKFATKKAAKKITHKDDKTKGGKKETK